MMLLPQCITDFRSFSHGLLLIYAESGIWVPVGPGGQRVFPSGPATPLAFRSPLTPVPQRGCLSMLLPLLQLRLLIPCCQAHVGSDRGFLTSPNVPKWTFQVPFTACIPCTSACAGHSGTKVNQTWSLSRGAQSCGETGMPSGHIHA